MAQFYEGSESLFVRAYDAFYRVAPPPIAGDVAFYERLARKTGGPVLELACGTGRIALALADHGLDVTGADISEGMLAVAERKAGAQRVSFIQQDMTELSVPQRYGCIVVAFRSFQHLLSVDLQRRALGAIHRHLAPHGRLVMHLFDPRLDLLMDETVRQPPLTGSDPVTRHRYVGEVLRVRLDHVAQIRRDVWRYREYAADNTLLSEDTREMALRWTYRWELRHLLELCGFEVEAEYSDFADSPPAYGKEQVVVARTQVG